MLRRMCIESEVNFVDETCNEVGDSCGSISLAVSSPSCCHPRGAAPVVTPMVGVVIVYGACGQKKVNRQTDEPSASISENSLVHSVLCPVVCNRVVV